MAYAKLQAMLDAAMRQAGEESSMLLGQDLTVEESDILNTDKKSYCCDMDYGVYSVVVESREAYQGKFYLLFELGDAITMSSILLGIPDPRIREKRRLNIQEPDDVDAFGEIANQIIGSFNSVFQPKLPEKVHLKLLTPVRYIPEIDQLTDDIPFPEGNYVMYRVPLAIPGQEMNRLDIMVPRDLAKLFDPEGDAEEAAAAEAQAVVPVEEKATPGVLPQSILVLGDETERGEIIENLGSCGLKMIDAPLSADIPALCAQSEVKIAVITLKHTADRDLAVCNRIVPFLKKRGGSVILCSPEWTRTSLLKALKAGAKEVLLRPFAADELKSKIGRMLNA
ncbi:response regulator [Geomesophilobacter sediminis]|uniref:Response regulator n=1 Tax=Geomesophilobacter sediminis TaxID=2798584 RepID=A0A8J7J1P9_9BACT|nr:response regulator [Geomesophilobacter sediminis]MBJ6724738.1 response regulator [Geomesophilobacter sediminis]